MFQKPYKTYFLHLFLFILTFFTTSAAGAEWVTGKAFFFVPEAYQLPLSEIWRGFPYAISFLLILSFHEFGHYFTAKYYRLDVTLPFYIPFWLGLSSSLGTFGAFIRIKSPIFSRKQFFDIGIAGPLAGFVVALGVLFYGFTHLPPPEHIFTIHPEYQQYGSHYADFVYERNKGNNMVLGTNLLFEFFKHYVADSQLLPHENEIMHYPYLLAGFLSLFFTALNLIPIGQLDGGHILYGLIGSKKHKIASFSLFFLFVTYAGLGLFLPTDDITYLMLYLPAYILFLYVVFRKTFEDQLSVWISALGVVALQFIISAFFPSLKGYHGWLVFAALISRVLGGIYHPSTEQEEPLDWKRQVIGWISLILFILCFSPEPIRVV